MKIRVTWCKWSFACGYYCLHTRTFRNIERARKFDQKIQNDRRRFIWNYEIDGKEVEEL